MPDMAEHVEGDRVLHATAQGARQIMSAVAVMMDGPDGEKRRHAMRGQHRHDVVLQHATAGNAENPGDPRCAHREFSANGRLQPLCAVTKSGRVEQHRECRAEKHRAPRRHRGAAAFTSSSPIIDR